MSMLKLGLQSSYGDIGAGYFGDLFPSLGGCLYSAVTFGSDMPLVPGRDYSGNDRDLIPSDGVVLQNDGFVSSATSYFDAAFNANQLLADTSGGGVAGEFTILCLARQITGSQRMLVCDFSTSVTNLVGLGTGNAASNRVRVVSNSPFFEALINGVDNVGGWELVGGVYTPTQIRGERLYGEHEQQTATTAATGTRQGTSGFRVGSHKGTPVTYNGSSMIRAVGFYNRALSSLEFAQVFAQVRKFSAGWGVLV